MRVEQHARSGEGSLTLSFFTLKRRAALSLARRGHNHERRDTRLIASIASGTTANATATMPAAGMP